jgi:hypothetical protein
MNTLPAGYKMSDKAVSRLEGSDMIYRINGWTDEQMIEHGIIELINPKKTVADAWEYFGGVWPPECTTHIFMGQFDPFYTQTPVCTRQEFESYGRNRKVQADKTANAMVEKFEKVMSKWVEGEQLLDARQLSKAGNIALAARTGKNAVNQFAKQSKAMEKIIADMAQERAIEAELAAKKAAHSSELTEAAKKRAKEELEQIDNAILRSDQKLKALQTELNKSREENNFIQKESRILQRVAIEHKAIIARLHEQDEKSSEANDHLRYMDKQQSKELKKQELSHIAKNTIIKQLQTELDKVRGDNDVATSETRALRSITEEQRAEIAHLKEVNTHGHNANYHLQEEVKKLVRNNRNLNGRVSSQANELDQLHSMYSEQAERCNEITAIKLNLEKTIQNLTALTGTKEPKNDD